MLNFVYTKYFGLHFLSLFGKRKSCPGEPSSGGVGQGVIRIWETPQYSPSLRLQELGESGETEAVRRQKHQPGYSMSHEHSWEMKEMKMFLWIK